MNLYTSIPLLINVGSIIAFYLLGAVLAAAEAPFMAWLCGIIGGWVLGILPITVRDFRRAKVAHLSRPPFTL